MRAPDYISPVVAYRLWQWDASGLRSLNGVAWIPGQPLIARCRALRPRKLVGLPAHVGNDAPDYRCRCGVYASKCLDTLRSMRFWDCGVRGEVLLWGTVVDEHGFRSQFAYPKSLHLPPDSLPTTLAEIQSRLRSLVAYGCDIFIGDDGGRIQLWRKESGLDTAGLDFLMGRGKEWCAARQRERRIKLGERVAIFGRGMAVVEQVSTDQVRAVLWNRGVLCISLKAIVWDERNMRWEANLRACSWGTRPSGSNEV